MAPVLTLQQIISLSRKGSYDTYYSTRQHYEADTCPFCLGNGLDLNVNRLLQMPADILHWIAWEAPAVLRPKSMQNGLARHIMIVPVQHVTSIFDFTGDPWAELNTVLKWVKEKFKIVGAIIIARTDDITMNGGTELHFSLQVKVPDRTMPNRPRMTEVFSKTGDEDDDNAARGERFAVCYAQGVSPERFNELVSAGTMSSDGCQASQI